jgi:hypothetical protein
MIAAVGPRLSGFDHSLLSPDFPLEAHMRILGVIGVLEIIVGIGPAVFFFGGIYSVAGTAENPAISVMR